MSKMDFKNARDPEQISRMKALKDAGLCYFCRKGDPKKVATPKIIKEGKYWYVTPNNFPLEGSVHHFMIVPKTHIKDLTEISEKASAELYGSMVSWLKKHVKAKGYSMFVRSGDTIYTGGTIDHMHFHFLIGGKKPKNASLGDVVPVVIAYKKR